MIGTSVLFARMERLDSVAPGLAAELAVLSGQHRHRLVSEALLLALSESGLDDVRMSRAVDRLAGRGASPTPEDLNSVVEELDRAAWDAQRDGDQDRYLLLFRRARAAAAVVYALEGQAAEAVYEASHALHEPAEIASLLKRHS
jgi:hypothetical protein